MLTLEPRWRRHFTRSTRTTSLDRPTGTTEDSCASNRRRSWRGATCRRQLAGDSRNDDRDRRPRSTRRPHPGRACLVGEPRDRDRRGPDDGARAHGRMDVQGSRVPPPRAGATERSRASRPPPLGREEPPNPWPAELGDEEDDPINAWIHERTRDRPLRDVLADVDRSYERYASAVAALPGGLGDPARCVPVARWQGARRCRAVRPPARRA